MLSAPRYSSIVHVYPMFPIHSSADERFAVVNNAATNDGCRYLFELISFPLCAYLEVSSLAHTVVQFTFPPAARKVFLPSAPLPALVISYLLDNSYSLRCEAGSHCGFGLHFPDDYNVYSRYHVPTGRLHIFFGVMSVQSRCPFLNQIVFLLFSCMSSLDILDINSPTR